VLDRISPGPESVGGPDVPRGEGFQELPDALGVVSAANGVAAGREGACGGVWG
jgi:hypothetical protein